MVTSLAQLLAHPPDLPVVAGLDAVQQALADGGVVVVQAPPGTGKTTMVPPAVATQVAGRVVVTQPRRIAARAAARRLASLLGEQVGGTVGFSVRGDRQVGATTRIEFVTTGVLLRRLQRDPELAGVDAVILDEVHERQLDADLTMAFLLDVRATLRDDLRLVAMSATIEAERTAAVLAGEGGHAAVPVVAVPGVLHDIAVHWAPPPPGVLPTDERGVPPRFLDHVAATVRHALATDVGDVLVFVPGVGEVGGLVRRLSGLGDVDVHPLHGRLPSREQDLALSPGHRRRVIVSTAVAESSLTVPGVRVVVDAGLSREPRTDQRRGLPALVTVRVSRSSAEQRAGRAGREAAGAVHRCWSRADHAHLADHPSPEIAVADLTALGLELAAWGAPGGAGLALLDAPPEAAMAAAQQTLLGLGAVDESGAITGRGRQMVRVPVDPRLARALLDGSEVVGSRRSAEVVALLADEVRAPGGDLVAALRTMRRGGPGAGAWKETVHRLESSLESSLGPDSRTELTDDLAVGVVVALAHPGRIARLRPGGTSYLMVAGTGATFRRGDPALGGVQWIAIADAERRPGATDALIRSAAPLDEDLALEAASNLWREVDEVTWTDGRLIARRVTRLGAVELSSAPISQPAPELVAAAVRDALATDGLAMLPWSESAVALRQRLDFLHRAIGEPWPDVGDAALLGSISVWLGADLARIRSTRDLRRIDVLSALRRLLPWPAAGRLDELAPERLKVPSGSHVRVDYAPEQPVLALRIQEAFGWAATPRIADGRIPVLLHLLTPARRPAAVTADLESFWSGPYQQVRSELRGRYPKHAWPEDPWTAPATRGPARRPRS